MSPLILAGLGGCMTLDGFFFANSAVTQYAFPTDVIPPSQVEEVAFESEDGTALYGMWAWQETAGTAPTIIHFHGNTGNMDNYMDRVDSLWGMGFNVYTFDYRGFGRSEGQPTHSGIVMDGRSAVVEVMDTLGLEDASTLAYNGVSLGGSVALHTSLDLPPSSLISEDMFSNAENLTSMNTSGLAVPAGWFFEQGFDNVSAAAELEGVPYLVMHGAEDDYILTEHGLIVYGAANDPKELWIVPGSGHADAHTSDPEAYAEHVLGWTERWR